MHSAEVNCTSRPARLAISLPSCNRKRTGCAPREGAVNYHPGRWDLCLRQSWTQRSRKCRGIVVLRFIRSTQVLHFSRAARCTWRPRNSSPCACAAKLTSTLDKSEKCSREEECATAPRRILGVFGASLSRVPTTPLQRSLVQVPCAQILKVLFQCHQIQPARKSEASRADHEPDIRIPFFGKHRRTDLVLVPIFDDVCLLFDVV